jgi:nucleoside-diphosphate-sugar epimerase
MRDREVCITGRHGFIGAALAKHYGAVTSFPVPETRILFHFGSYTHPTFEQNPHYLMQQQLEEFSRLLLHCYDHGIRFVYPSSALIYERDTQFSLFKKTLERLTECYETRTLGLRIFPVYGPGETRTVISQWARQMARGEAPIVYGDGEQSRAFIYIDDAVGQIVELVERCAHRSGVHDVGSDTRIVFNDIVGEINKQLGTEIKPRYVNRPSSYSEGFVCPNPLPVKVPINVGIRNILNALKCSNQELSRQ